MTLTRRGRALAGLVLAVAFVTGGLVLDADERVTWRGVETVGTP